MLILLALPGGKQMGNSVSLWKERGKREVEVEGENKPKKGNSLRGLQLMAEQIVSKNNFMHKERKYISS